jgi:hypothetical protein
MAHILINVQPTKEGSLNGYCIMAPYGSSAEGGQHNAFFGSNENEGFEAVMGKVDFKRKFFKARISK